MNTHVIHTARPGLVDRLGGWADPACLGMAVHQRPLVLALHCSTASGRQWDALVAELGGSHDVLAPDLYGHGRCQAWTAAAPLSLDDEVDRLIAQLPPQRPLHIVGHSYGGAVALKLAQRLHERVRSLVVYEPALFRWLLDDWAQRAAAREITGVARHVALAVQHRRLEDAGRTFIDYWGGHGNWAAMPRPARERIAERMRQIPAQFEALFAEALEPNDIARWAFPILVLGGSRSTAAASAVVDQLQGLLRGALVQRLDGLGHMGPLTDPAQVNRLLAGFLRETAMADVGFAPGNALNLAAA